MSDKKKDDRKNPAPEDVTESADTSEEELSAEELDETSGGLYTSPIGERAFNPQPEPPTKEWGSRTLDR